MKGGIAIYCPQCHHRQAVGERGQIMQLPLHIACDKCGVRMLLEKSDGGGLHITLETAGVN